LKGKKLLKSVSAKMTGEFYTPMPPGYKSGRTKYVVITGSVISGLGKGTMTSSICKLFADRGLNVEPIKLEAYLNVDAGTLNPFRHGEVFVLDDGTETDMDLGSYERFVDKNLGKDNFVTSGRIYQGIIEKERRGEYLGRDVQFIPHVTGEIKKVLRDLAANKKPDVIVIEIGGTVGDYENMFALEAIRQLVFEEGRENVCFLNLTYIIEPPSLGEFKSKAAQLGIKGLLSLGIQPDIIICRSHSPIPLNVREKISISSNVPVELVIGVEDIGKIFELPLELRERGLDEKILKLLEWDKRFKINGSRLADWTKKNRASKNAKKLKIGIAGKYTEVHDAYISILKALEHCEGTLDVKVEVEWLETTDYEKKPAKINGLKKLDGVIIPGGFGKRGAEGKVMVAGYCREHNIPFLGLCYGFQMAVISFAREVCGLKEANSTETIPGCCEPVIDLLPEQMDIISLGGNMRLGGHDVELKPGTIAFKIHGNQKTIRRRFRHRWELNPKYIECIEKKGMVFSGKAPKQPIMQVLELPNHKFYMASQYHPELTSRPLNPDPLFLNFIKAARG
jgi:CTP synthase